MPEEFCLRIPLAYEWVKASSPNPIRLTQFHLPAPYCRLKKMYFQARGCVALFSGTSPDKITIELVTDQENAFEFRSSATVTGVTADTSRKLAWKRSDFPYQLSDVTAIEMKAAEEYHMGSKSLSWDYYDRGNSWSPEDELSVWLCLYDYGSATSGFRLSGDLILVFEKTLAPVFVDEAESLASRDASGLGVMPL